MKKIIFLIIALLFLTSCGAKRKTTSTQNTTKTRRVVKDRSKIDHRSVVIGDRNVRPSKIKMKSKTVFDEQILDDLYTNKTKLESVKVAYIKKYGRIAVREMEAYKIPASITLAQGLLESGSGQSYLTKSSKNHFGIKCHTWSGDRVYHDDDAKGECFRKYKHAENSYRDHSLFLSKKKRYEKLFTYAENDYESWAKGLRKAGYATDKKYPQKLINLIEKYELYVFDSFVLGEDYKPEVKEKLDKKTQMHIVALGETLYSISGIYYVPVEEIKKINNLTSDVISVGQKIIVVKGEEKKNQAKKYNKEKGYIVVKGDTIYSIARKNNISVNKIKVRNNLDSDNIAIGQKLILE